MRFLPAVRITVAVPPVLGTKGSFPVSTSFTLVESWSFPETGNSPQLPSLELKSVSSGRMILLQLVRVSSIDDEPKSGSGKEQENNVIRELLFMLRPCWTSP